MNSSLRGGVATKGLSALSYGLFAQWRAITEGATSVFVAVSSASFPDLSMAEMLDVLLDLQFSHFELDVHEQQGHLKPSSVLANLDNAIDECRATRRLTICALNLGITAEGETYYEQFAACCKLAKAVKVVTMVVPSAELGTPFNAEVE